MAFTFDNFTGKKAGSDAGSDASKEKETSKEDENKEEKEKKDESAAKDNTNAAEANEKNGWDFNSLFDNDWFSLSETFKAANNKPDSNAANAVSDQIDKNNPFSVVDGKASFEKTSADDAWWDAQFDLYDSYFTDTGSATITKPTDAAANGTKPGDASANGTKPADAATTAPAENKESSWTDWFSFDTWANFLQGDTTDKPAEPAKPAEPQPKPEEKAEENAVTQAAEWLASQWDRLFGGGGRDCKNEKHSFRQQGDNGKEGETTLGTDQVRNVTTDANGNKISDTKVTKSGVTDTNQQGDTAEYDKINKILTERGIHGAEVKYNVETKHYEVSDGRGRTFEITPQGDLVHRNRFGTRTVAGHEFIDHQMERHSYRIRQNARRDESQPDENGEGEQERAATQEKREQVASVTDVKTGEEMVVVNNGEGTVMKLHQDGRKLIQHTDEDGRKIQILARQGSDKVVAVIDGQNYYIEQNKQNGQWEVFDGPAGKRNKIGRIDDGMMRLNNGQEISGIQTEGNKLKLGRGTTVDGNGDIRMEGQQGAVAIRRDSTDAQLQNAEGNTEAVVSAKGAESRFQEYGASGPQPGQPGELTIADTATGVAKAVETKRTEDGQDVPSDPEGKSIWTYDSEAERTGKGNVFSIETAEGKPVTFQKNEDGTYNSELWNGDKIDANEGLKRSSGVEIDWDGSVRFADGSYVDPDGRVYDKDGSYMGGYGEEGSSPTSTGQINAVLSAARDLMSKPNPTAGDVAYLLSLLGVLGAVKGEAMKAGDAGAFFSADLAAATVSASISQANIQIHQEAVVSHFAALPKDVLAQIHKEMGNLTSFEGVRHELEKRHLAA